MIDRLLELFAGWMLYHIGKRAYQRGDYHEYGHAMSALKSGNCDSKCRGNKL